MRNVITIVSDTKLDRSASMRDISESPSSEFTRPSLNKTFSNYNMGLCSGSYHQQSSPNQLKLDRRQEFAKLSRKDENSDDRPSLLRTDSYVGGFDPEYISSFRRQRKDPIKINGYSGLSNRSLHRSCDLSAVSLHDRSNK